MDLDPYKIFPCDLSGTASDWIRKEQHGLFYILSKLLKTSFFSSHLKQMFHKKSNYPPHFPMSSLEL